MPTVIETLGWLPESIWMLNKGNYWNRFIDDTGDPIGAKRLKNNPRLGDYQYSSFNPVLAERIYQYWSEAGSNVLDPFAGRTTRGLVARVMGRNYEGYEIAPITFEQTRQNLLDIEFNWQPSMFSNKMGSWSLWNEDGTLLAKTQSNNIDLIFTCPPYWKLEKYEQAIGQLSRVSTYSNFIYHITECARNCYRVLRQKGYCVWVVSDFRIDRKLYPFHVDTIQTFQRAGLILHDIIINKLNSPFVMRTAKTAELKYTLKIHEYIIVWKKL